MSRQMPKEWRWVKWLFSGLGVFFLTTLINRCQPSLESRAETEQHVNTGSNSIVVQGNQGSTNVSVSQSPDNRLEEIYPVVEMSHPVEAQVQLFPTDIVVIYADPDILEEVCLGDNFCLPYEPGQEYIAAGPPGEPITPQFILSENGKNINRIKMHIKLSVSYKDHLEKPRDLR